MGDITFFLDFMDIFLNGPLLYGLLRHVLEFLHALCLQKSECGQSASGY